jgi:hypothetical protein
MTSGSVQTEFEMIRAPMTRSSVPVSVSLTLGRLTH